MSIFGAIYAVTTALEKWIAIRGAACLRPRIFGARESLHNVMNHAPRLEQYVRDGCDYAKDGAAPRYLIKFVRSELADSAVFTSVH
jgi:hypothetical protein